MRTTPPNMIDFDDKITSRLFGYNGALDYYDRSCCSHVLKHITIPMFFLNAMDDPVIGEVKDFYHFSDNKNLLLGTTKHGGHMGYNEDWLSSNFWFCKPAFRFFETFF